MTNLPAGAIVQAFYAAVNAKDLAQASQFLGEDVRFATLDGDLIGKAAVTAYLQMLTAAHVTFAINVTAWDATTVHYTYRILAQGKLIDVGENGLAHVCHGLICFDGTATTNS